MLKNDPGNLTALYNQGALYATLGRNDDAARSWKKILTLAPSGDEAKRAQAGLAAIGR
jgi:cytochrome c-type biogenesis protein CcmH/NrfG